MHPIAHSTDSLRAAAGAAGRRGAPGQVPRRHRPQPRARRAAPRRPLPRAGSAARSSAQTPARRYVGCLYVYMFMRAQPAALGRRKAAHEASCAARAPGGAGRGGGGGRGGAAAAAAHSVAPVRCDAAAKRAPDSGALCPVCGHVGEVQTPPAPPARERRRVKGGGREGGGPGYARVLRRVAGVRGRDVQHERCRDPARVTRPAAEVAAGAARGSRRAAAWSACFPSLNPNPPRPSPRTSRGAT